MRNKFTGVGVALITPFNEDLSVDYKGLQAVLQQAIDGGVDYIVVNGTTSEASTLKKGEKSEILNFVATFLDNRLPIMYGIGANDTNHVLDLIKETDFSHVDAILTVSPYYNKPSQYGIESHYIDVANASPVPVLLYNVPGRTGSNVDASTTLRLAQHPNIFGIKEASGDLSQCLDIMKDKPDDFMLISGDDILTIPMISIGAEGVISVLANAFPDSFSECIHKALNGDFTGGTAGLHRFLGINKLLYLESNPVGIKEALTNIGICDRYVRKPLLPASLELRNQIAQELSQVKAIQ